MKKRSTRAYFAATATKLKVRKRPGDAIKQKHPQRVPKKKKAKKRRRFPRLSRPRGLKNAEVFAPREKPLTHPKNSLSQKNAIIAHVGEAPCKKSLTENHLYATNAHRKPNSPRQTEQKAKAKTTAKNKSKKDGENPTFSCMFSKRLKKPNRARALICNVVKCFLLAAIAFKHEENAGKPKNNKNSAKLDSKKVYLANEKHYN